MKGLGAVRPLADYSMEGVSMSHDENVEAVAKELMDFARKRGKELGEECTLAFTFECLCCAKDAFKKFAVLLALLGPEKVEELADVLMRSEIEKTVGEAEDFLKGSDW